MWTQYFSKLTAQRCLLSLSLTRFRADWVLVELPLKGMRGEPVKLHSGSIVFDQEIGVGEDGGFLPEGVKSVVETIRQDALNLALKPVQLLLAIPSSQGYLGEMTIESEEGDQSVDALVQLRLDSLASGSTRAMAHDWKVKGSGELSDSLLPIVIGAIPASFLKSMEQVAAGSGMQLVGLTFQNHCLADALMQAMPEQELVDCQVFLLAQMSRREVRLCSFSDGSMLEETLFESESPLTNVQAIGALERLVTGWGRTQLGFEASKVKLMLCGELCLNSQLTHTALRSDLLNPLIYQPKLATQDREDMYLYQAPMGAIRGLLCE